MNLTHRERLQTCLNGEQPDRPPVALWRHFPVDDQSPEALAAATLHFQSTYDFDLVKVTPASSFCLKDWGAEDAWTADPEGPALNAVEGTRRYTKRVIKSPQDWESLPILAPSAPHLAGQLACLRFIKQHLDPETPVIQTIFSPLAQAKNLAGNETLLTHLRLYPEAVLKGLETIARTARRFVEAALATGIDGIFYAVQHAQAALLSHEEYKAFGLPFDRQVVEPAQACWLNMLHLHGRNVYFSLLSSLSFPVVNWHDRETPPSLAEAQQAYAGTVCGGLRRDTLAYRKQAEVQKEAREAIQQTGGRRFILSTGCVVPIIASHGNLSAARRSVEAESQ
ncbi:MAG: uroporphyrinogen decarboxylase family protein [Anaerolineales bacterium]